MISPRQTSLTRGTRSLVKITATPLPLALRIKVLGSSRGNLRASGSLPFFQSAFFYPAKRRRFYRAIKLVSRTDGGQVRYPTVFPVSHHHDGTLCDTHSTDPSPFPPSLFFLLTYAYQRLIMKLTVLRVRFCEMRGNIRHAVSS